MVTFKAHFQRAFLLRYHMTLILGGSVAVGVLTQRLLLSLGGVELVSLRLPVAVVTAYLFFFVLVRIWLWYIRATFVPHPVYDDTLEDHGSSEERAAPRKKEKDGGWDLSGLDGLVDMGDEGGCLLLVGGFFVILIIGAALLLLMEAPVVLAETALQFFLGLGLVRPLKRIDRADWKGSVFRATWKPFVWIFALACLLALSVQLSCPGARTIREAIGCA